MITGKNIFKSFNGLLVNDDISFALEPGTITGFLGPNGAGKSTLVKIIAGVINQDKGQIFFQNIEKKRGQTIDKLGVVFEGANNAYGYLTVENNLTYFSYLNNISPKIFRERIGKLLEFWDLELVKNRYYYDLSQGMKQKVLIAVCLLKDPDALILDEPTLGLDVLASQWLKSKLLTLCKDLKKTILIASHNFAFIEDVCDNIILIDKGKIKFSDTIDRFKNYVSNKPRFNVVLKKNENIKHFLHCSNIKFIEKNKSILINIPDIFLLEKHIKSDEVVDIKTNNNITESFMEFLNEKSSMGRNS